MNAPTALTTPLELCPSDAIEAGSSRGFQVGEHSCFAVKNLDGDIFVYANRCPHLGVELEWVADQFLDSEGALIQCATHGALFVIETGHCVAGPCNGQYLKTIPSTVEQGMLQIDSNALKLAN